MYGWCIIRESVRLLAQEYISVHEDESTRSDSQTRDARQSADLHGRCGLRGEPRLGHRERDAARARYPAEHRHRGLLVDYRRVRVLLRIIVLVFLLLLRSAPALLAQQAVDRLLLRVPSATVGGGKDGPRTFSSSSFFSVRLRRLRALSSFFIASSVSVSVAFFPRRVGASARAQPTIRRGAAGRAPRSSATSAGSPAAGSVLAIAAWRAVSRGAREGARLDSSSSSASGLK